MEFTSIEVAGIALVIGFPLLLMLAVVLLGRLERWILYPDLTSRNSHGNSADPGRVEFLGVSERAEQVEHLSEEVDEVEALERVAARLRDPADEYARRQRTANESALTDQPGDGSGAARREAERSGALAATPARRASAD